MPTSGPPQLTWLERLMHPFNPQRMHDIRLPFEGGPGPDPLVPTTAAPQGTDLANTLLNNMEAKRKAFDAQNTAAALEGVK